MAVIHLFTHARKMFPCLPMDIWFFLLVACATTSQLDLLSLGAGVTAIASLSRLPYCMYNECCNKRWYNETVNLSDLSSYIYGQEHIIKIAANSIEWHILNEHPVKPLVIALTGPPGTGKNYFSELIAQRLFYLGTRSKYVKIIIGTQHFIKDRTKEEYQHMLITTLKSVVSKCPKRTLFILDEVDKFPYGVIDILKPIFDRYEVIDGIDFRKSVFILIGNRGQHEISQFLYENFQKGIDRTNIPQHEIERIVKSVVYHNPSNSSDTGMYHSRLIENGLIDIFLPFYPLERNHLLRCIKWEIEKLPVAAIGLDECASKILKYIEFYPANNPIFSLDGCKKINFLTNTFCY